MFPKPHDDAIFIAEHGPWNRSSKVGYRVVVAHVGKVAGFEPLLSGFLDGQSILGRPFEVQPMHEAACWFPMTTMRDPLRHPHGEVTWINTPIRGQGLIRNSSMQACSECHGPTHGP
jgi:hypothetical protein